MAELKPCPFCGCEADTFKQEERDYFSLALEKAFWLFGVGCYGCGCQVYGYDTEQEAIEAWNTRADDIDVPTKERTCNMVPNGEHGYAAVLACSVCGNTESVYAISADDFNYCPNCGAKVVQDAD